LFTVSDSVHIRAQIERCFLLATDIGFARRTMGMRPVAGKIRGKMVGNDRIVWRGRMLGLPQMYESLITRYERPEFFQDTMVCGGFRRFRHDHQFIEIDGQTLLIARVWFSLPLGRVGRIVGRWLVVPYVMKLLRRRVALLKHVAEGEEWRVYLEESEPAGLRVSDVRGVSESLSKAESLMY
jgi:ligand-binding SRPBCC domain-containing protein